MLKLTLTDGYPLYVNVSHVRCVMGHHKDAEKPGASIYFDTETNWGVTESAARVADMIEAATPEAVEIPYSYDEFGNAYIRTDGAL
jgi:hypothetical protein